jgi:microcystin-dependent protein
MSSPFVAEIRIFAGNFAPTGWAACDGQLLPISQNTALFSLLGTFYGGNGQTNFALPNLQDSAPLGQGAGAGLTTRSLGEAGGSATTTLLASEIPLHTHALSAATARAGGRNPTGQVLARSSGATVYTPTGQPDMPLHAQALALAGSSFPHNNMQPYLTLMFIIAMQGVFPARQ